jgi:hypothetical protein
LSYIIYQQKQEEKQQWSLFMNHFYHSIGRSIQWLDTLIEKQPEEDHLIQVLHSLDKELLTAETILLSGRYVNRDIYSDHHHFSSFSHLLFGIKHRRNGSVLLDLPPMAIDDKLDDKEVALLKTMKNNLTELKEAMYSPKTKQENPNLTIDAFNQLITTHLKRDAYDIYKQTFH